MATTDSDSELDDQIAEWRNFMRRRQAMHATDIDELEDHLRSQIAELSQAGLRTDEAFLIAVKRLGSLDELSQAFAREHSDRLWKQLVLTEASEDAIQAGSRRDLLVMVGCALAAALAIKIPAGFGLDITDDDTGFYLRNMSLFALAPLAVYFAWRRRVRPRVLGMLAVLFSLGAVGANVYPFSTDSDTSALAVIHLPLALWLAVGVAYTAGDWRSSARRMDFVRFTGEWFIYYVLLSLGGGVLIAFTLGTFDAIGLDASKFTESWLAPCGFVAGVVVSAWLVEAKQGVIENMAPVLTRVFTPLFTAILLAFLAAVVWTSSVIDVERDVLIFFDLLLVLVLGLLLYAISARDPMARPGVFDRLQLALVVSALIIDILVLLAITSRITEWGFSPNKVAALGENVILLTNLAWSAWLFFAFIQGRLPFARLERWQTSYIIVYAIWAWTVVFAFPPIFNFI